MNRVYWDSMLFIYLLEANPEFGPRVVQMYRAMQRRKDSLCTGIFTVGEVLTGPRKRNDAAGAQAIQTFFRGREVELLPFDLEAADRYSVIRAQGNVRQPDAIHLATAARASVDLFVTNDESLRKLVIPGIKFFADLDGKLY
jgi:predicted nucleic acid-binding protein